VRQYRLQGGDSLNTLESINQNGIGSILILLDVMMQKAKFYAKDCLPNVHNLEYYFKNSDAILVKTAPLLDISAGILELQNVKPFIL
jgi:hypothetical protein